MRNSEPDADSHGNALSDAYVPTGRFAWSVDAGSACSH